MKFVEPPSFNAMSNSACASSLASKNRAEVAQHTRRERVPDGAPIQRRESPSQLLSLTQVAEQLPCRGANDGQLLPQLRVITRVVCRRLRSQVHPPQDLSALADCQCGPRLDQTQAAVVHDIAARELVHPPRDRFPLAGVRERQPVSVDQLGSRVELSSSRQVSDRLGHHPGLEKPTPGQTMEVSRAPRLSALELVPQQLAEQLVVPIPLMPWVEGNQEVIRTLDPVKHRPALGRARDGVAQRRTELVEHARVKQEVHLQLALLTEHLSCEIVDHPSIAASEGRDEAAASSRPRIDKTAR